MTIAGLETFVFDDFETPPVTNRRGPCGAEFPRKLRQPNLV